MGEAKVIKAAIEYCIRRNILKDFLSKQKAEVIKMSIFEYDEEREIELIRRDEREIGRKIGEEIGAEKERKKAEKELKKAKQELDENKENTIRSIVSLCKEMGGNPELAVQKVIKNCGLTGEQAKEKVTLYWG